MKIRIEPPGPIDVEATLARYRIWGEDPVNRLGPGSFRRILDTGAASIPYEIRWSGPVNRACVEVEVAGETGARVRDAVEREVRAVLGLTFDLRAFHRFAEREPVLRELIDRHPGLRPTLTPAPFELLVTSITAQQVNLSFAFACRARLVRSYGTAVTVGHESIYTFPTAAVLSEAEPAHLRELKYSTRKAEYIRGLARSVAAGELRLDDLGAAPNAEVVARLTGCRGLGRWTAEWFLARCLGRGDVCPAGDLAVRKAFEHYFGKGQPMDEDAVRRRAEEWGEHQNLAVHYLLAGHRAERAEAKAASSVSGDL